MRQDIELQINYKVKASIWERQNVPRMDNVASDILSYVNAYIRNRVDTTVLSQAELFIRVLMDEN